MTMRELATDATGIAYNVAGPTSSSTPYPKYASEELVFDAASDLDSQCGLYVAGRVVGYIEMASGSATFSRLCG